MSIYTYIRSHAVVASATTLVVIAAVIIGGRIAGRNKAAETTNDSATRKVTLTSVTSFKSGTTTIAGDGVVESVSQVDLKSQLSAPLASVNVTIGQNVIVGQTIAELQNADIRAQLEQARGSLQIAQGQYSSGNVSLESARRAAINTMRDAYQKSDVGVHTDLDPFLLNNASGISNIYSFITDEKINYAIRDARTRLTPALTTWKSTLDTLSASSTNEDIESALTLSENNISNISGLLTTISQALTDAAQFSNGSYLTLINGWQTTVASLRTTMSTLSTNLTTADTTLTNAQVSINGAASASVETAQAGVKNLEAQLAKTIFTSPINGKVASLPLRVGELATPGQLIATIVGGGGLQVKAYISSEDLPRVKPGAKVVIENSINGVVTNVSPSVDETTKKVQVTVSITGQNTSDLVIGENVSLTIEAEPLQTSVENSYLLPIQYVKIVPGNAYVFTVDQNQTVVAHPVTLSKVQGNFVEVVGGLTDSMSIASPVYELEASEKVQVQ